LQVVLAGVESGPRESAPAVWTDTPREKAFSGPDTDAESRDSSISVTARCAF
jgi:hypothetical protein